MYIRPIEEKQKTKKKKEEKREKRKKKQKNKKKKESGSFYLGFSFCFIYFSWLLYNSFCFVGLKQKSKRNRKRKKRKKEKREKGRKEEKRKKPREIYNDQDMYYNPQGTKKTLDRGRTPGPPIQGEIRKKSPQIFKNFGRVMS